MNTPDIILENILHRRTTKPAKMNGTKIDNQIIDRILSAADAAPTHARTEPWRFHIYSGGSLAAFCAEHIRLYEEHTPSERHNQNTIASLSTYHQHASHLVIVTMQRTIGAKIPWEEEYAACCASVQNIMLMARAYNITSLWSTGLMAYHPSMKAHLRLGDEDRVVGLIYLGYTDEDVDKMPVRSIPISDKVLIRS